MVILAAVGDGDRSGNVLAEAATLASTFGEPLVGLHVMPQEEFEERVDGRPDYSIETAESNAQQTVVNAFQHVADGAPEFEPVGRVGGPASNIVAEATERDTRYIVVGGRKRSPTGKAVFGSVTQSVILNASRPVLTVLRKEN